MRKPEIDFLRALGIVLVILAHCSYLPHMIMQIRNFDVPLMVMVSAMSYALTPKENGNYKEYLIKRFKRLIIPAWIYITVFIVLTGVVDANVNYDVIDLIDSYTFKSGIADSYGIGYVWIIGILFCVDMLAPLICRPIKKYHATKNIAFCVSGMIFYGLVVEFIPTEFSNGGVLLSLFGSICFDLLLWVIVAHYVAQAIIGSFNIVGSDVYCSRDFNWIW